MKPADKAKEIIRQVFYLQHADVTAKMICLSTPAIAIAMCVQIKLACATMAVVIDRRIENKGIDDEVGIDDVLNDTCFTYWDAVIAELKKY